MKPCRECPFSRTVKPNALGGSPPETYIGQALGPYAIPCHCHIDYDDPQWREKAINTEQCRGAAIYRANIGVADKLPSKLLRLPPDKYLVFASAEEFLAHHRQIDIIEAMFMLSVMPPEQLLQEQLNRPSNIIYPITESKG